MTSGARAREIIAEATGDCDIDATYDPLRRLSCQTSIDDIDRHIVVAYNEREARAGICANDGVALSEARLIGGGSRAYAVGARIALSDDETPKSVVFRLYSCLRGI